MLPTGYSLPLIHTALIDGSSQDTEPFDDDAADADADADASDPITLLPKFVVSRPAHREVISV
jgi:hypothetical protein